MVKNFLKYISFFIIFIISFIFWVGIISTTGIDLDYNKSDDLDLHLELGGVPYVIDGYLLADNTWNIKVRLYDTYDFERKKYNSFVNIINNGGYWYQKTMLLNKYNWDVRFSYNYDSMKK